MISRKHDDARGEFGMTCQCIKKFGPFAGPAGIRHVAADQHVVERINGVNLGKPRQHAIEAFVSLRTSRPAFDAETVSLADHVEIGQMCKAPETASGRRCVERGKISRLVHTGVGYAPGQ